jgi:cyclophilin family peptidyl-prolyl cis-trans isomerase
VKRIWLVTCCALAGMLAGCGASGPDAVLRDIRAANEDAAAAIGKAKDLDALKDIMKGRDKKFSAAMAKAKKLPREDRQTFVEQLEDKGMPGADTLDKAFKEFQESAMQGPNPTVVMSTSMGDVTIELYEKLAPVTVKNFLAYVDDKFYDGKIFHRVMPDFMIQGGGFEPGDLVKKHEKKTREAIVNESYNGFSNARGTIAMARTNDPDSATAQFFINVKDNPNLDRARAPDSHGYAAFGKVTGGMDVVDKIRRVPTRSVAGHDDVPVEDVIIKSIRRVDKK